MSEWLLWLLGFLFRPPFEKEKKMAQDFTQLDQTYSDLGLRIDELKTADGQVDAARSARDTAAEALTAKEELLVGKQGEYENADTATETALDAVVQAAKGVEINLPG